MAQSTFEFAIPLNWEYCECGCHGSSLTIAGRVWYRYIDFPGWNPGTGTAPTKETVVLLRNHGRFGTEVFRYASVNCEADSARERANKYIRDQLVTMRDELNFVLKGHSR
jgi:hypothetical protein